MSEAEGPMPETRRRRGGQGLIRTVDSGGRGHERVGDSLRSPVNSGR